MTFVTDQELGALKSLFKMNHIDPVWHGTIPDLQAAFKLNGRRDGKKFFKKQLHGMPPKRIHSSGRNDSNAAFMRSL
jgi:hypothetical protein